MSNFGEDLGRYWGDLRAAADKTKVTAGVLGVTWASFPTAIQSVFHPADAVGFQYWLQREPVPQLYTAPMLTAGELSAVVTLVGLGLLMLGVTTLFYRGTGFWVRLWPAAGLTAGLVGNVAWWIGKGSFDPAGALAGLTPLAAMVICEAICEHFGADFVFGKGQRPQRT